MVPSPAGAAPRVHRGRSRPHQDWLRHLLLGLCLVVVSVSVVAMHQLSVGHEVATGQHADATGAEGAAVEMRTAHTTSMAGMAEVPAGDVTAGVAGTAGEGCPGCGDHEVAFGSCLLALTLLVFTWTLLPPQPRQLPPSLRPLPASDMVVRPAPGRLVPALSLTELSLRRT